MAGDAEEEFGVSGGEIEATDQAADFFLGEIGALRIPLGDRGRLPGGAHACFQVTAGAEGVEQDRGEALEITGGGGECICRLRSGFGATHKFVEADGNGVAKVHRAMRFASGNAEEPLAVADVLIGEAALFRTKEKGDAAAPEALADEARGFVEAPDGVPQFAAADGGGSDDEGAVCDGVGHGLEFLGAGEQRRSSDSGTRFAKRQLERIHHPEMKEAEIAHGAGGGADVQRVARIHEDDAQVVELGEGRQGRRVYSRREIRK